MHGFRDVSGPSRKAPKPSRKLLVLKDKLSGLGGVLRWRCRPKSARESVSSPAGFFLGRRRPEARLARPHRYSPGLDLGGDEALLPRLRHERDRGARVAGRPRRPQAGAPAHPLFDARAGPHARQEVRQVGPRGRRRDGQVSPARRSGDLRRAGAHGAGFLHAPAADRRAGQFRLGRRRSAGGHAVHRMPPRQVGDGTARGHRQGHRRFPGELRRQRERAGGPAGALPEPAGQRRRRHRGRHGDQHPAAQSRRGDRRRDRADRQSRARHRRSDRDRARARTSRPAASSWAAPASAPPITSAAARS